MKNGKVANQKFWNPASFLMSKLLNFSSGQNQTPGSELLRDFRGFDLTRECHKRVVRRYQLTDVCENLNNGKCDKDWQTGKESLNQ